MRMVIDDIEQMTYDVWFTDKGQLRVGWFRTYDGKTVEPSLLSQQLKAWWISEFKRRGN